MITVTGTLHQSGPPVAVHPALPDPIPVEVTAVEMEGVVAEVVGVAEVAVINTASMNLKTIPYLGSGPGFRSEMAAEIHFYKNEIDFLEVIADHYMSPSARKLKELEILKEHFTCIPHGLDLSLGSADGIDDNYLDQLAEVIRFLDPPYWSEHISYTKAGGISIGHLAPLQRTNESVSVICRNIEKAQKKINKPLILENITCMIDPGSHEMSEPEFLNRITERSGCGLLLDVTNLFTNAANYKFDPLDFLNELHCENVVQLHYTGVHFAHGKVIDAHGEDTQPEIFELMAKVVSLCNVKGIILERDENIPPLKQLLSEIKTARTILQMPHAR
jgi:uncharacterized protein